MAILRSILSLLLVASTAQAFLQPAGKCATVRIGKDTALSQDVAEQVPETELELSPKLEDGTINWFKSWYPVVPVEILDPEVPHKFQLLGIDIVVWNDAPIEGGFFGSKKKRSRSAISALGVSGVRLSMRVPIGKFPCRKGASKTTEVCFVRITLGDSTAKAHS
jgi:hypothetical protein